MSSTHTSTTTYTVADVEKVVRNVRSDLLMIAASSKAMAEEKAKDYAHDIELLAKKNHVSYVDVTLLNSWGKEVVAVRFNFVSEGAAGTSRPGGVLWPATPDGRVRVVISHTAKYFDDGQGAAHTGMKVSWVSSTDDVSHSGLSAAGERGYSSNGYGANRSDFK